MRKNGCEVISVMVPVSSSLRSWNFFLYHSDNRLILIDAGMDTDNNDCWNFLQKTLHEHGWSVKDISHIILTHHHVDHVGLVNKIVEKHPIPVFAHSLSIPRLKRDEDFLSMRIEFFSKLYKEMGCGAQGEKRVAFLKDAQKNNLSAKIECNIHTFEESRFLDFEIIHVPGHAPDQVAFYQKECKWLFGGDLLLGHISSNALVEPDGAGNRMMTLVDHAHSLKEASNLHADIVFPGHGQIIENPQSLFKLRIDGIDRKANKFLSMLESRTATAADIAESYYKETYFKQFSLVMSEVIGHLDYLELIGKIKKEWANGVWLYSKAE